MPATNYGPYRVIEEPTEEYPIDLTILDGSEEVLRAFAPAENTSDLTIECTHPEVDFNDDDERGTCLLCGAECDWSWEGEDDEGHPERTITEWYDTLAPSPESILGNILTSA